MQDDGSSDTAEAGGDEGTETEQQADGDGETAEASKQEKEEANKANKDSITGLEGSHIVILAGMVTLVVIVIVVVIGCTIKKKQLAANRRNNRIVPDDDADVDERYDRRDEFAPDPRSAPPSYDDTVSPRGIDSMFQQDIFTTPSSGCQGPSNTSTSGGIDSMFQQDIFSGPSPEGAGPSTATAAAALARSPADMSRYNAAYARAYDTVAPQVSATNNTLPKKS